MDIYNRTNSRHTGQLPTLKSWMLISPQNAESKNLSVQTSEIPVDSEQPIHSHESEQCYYIIKGKGLMIIEDEFKEVQEGDAVLIPSNLKHGIKNIGNCTLEYLTTNSPVFSGQYENKLWSEEPSNNDIK